MHLSKIAAYGAGDLLTARVLRYGIMLTPATLAGAWTGKKIAGGIFRRRGSARRWDVRPVFCRQRDVDSRIDGWRQSGRRFGSKRVNDSTQPSRMALDHAVRWIGGHG